MGSDFRASTEAFKILKILYDFKMDTINTIRLDTNYRHTYTHRNNIS